MTEVKKREKKSFGSRQVSGPTHLVTCNKAGKLGAVLGSANHTKY
jgi:hypothetical protein